MDRLYLLALLLTGDHAVAESCFVTGLQDARGGNRVFKDWADTWARRTVILNAIRAVRPASHKSDHNVSNAVVAEFATGAPLLRALLEMPTFDRFIYVVCVLEGYSDHQCALLIGSTRKAVTEARMRAIETLGDPAFVQQQLHTLENERQLRPERNLDFPGNPLAATA
ncbi:hypothetical protein [Candidatus Korobacter versatilis]|nr:hypothetical protein [Candidatus Koribacter versatilis]